MYRQYSDEEASRLATKLAACLSEIAAQRVILAAIKLKQLILKYDPDQPRVPASNPDGGQWTDTGGSDDGYVLLAEAETGRRTDAGSGLGRRRQMPSFDKLWASYPRPTQGEPHAHPSSDTYARNQCAIRLSVALQKSGWDFSDYDTGPVTSVSCTSTLTFRPHARTWSSPP